MSRARWQRVETLFRRASEAETDARRELLAAARADEPDVASQVERLLERDAEASDGWLGELERGATEFQSGDPMLGREVGAYRLVERIAAGGMGVVYRAERSDGLFEQAVAVKLIRAERAGQGAVRRFQRERRALAALSHPNIARLHDGGTTGDGAPYLVMELVEGVPIDRYCDEERLSVSERLRLFVRVAHAVHFAHQNLIVHRDLKPSNVLIDGRGQPKLLDFGIAKLLAPTDAEGDATRTMASALTPEYASPEQLVGGPVTTAIDVYALGVLLYELLAGAKPFEHRGHSPITWQREVVEETPGRPSAALVPRRAAEDRDDRTLRVAACRRTTPAALRRRLEGDLDRIVLVALRKEPERRYASAQALAEDVERHLAGQPVLARGDSLPYRAAKFVRRNRIEVAAVLAVVLATVGALVATMQSERRARADAEHARIEAESSAGMAELVMDTFLTSTFTRDEERLWSARERVRLHAERVRRQYADEPHVRANLLDGLGRVALRLDAYDDAQRLLGEALALRERTFGARSLEYALSLRSMGHLELERGETEEAAAHLEEALELHRTLEPGTHTDVAAVANDVAVCRRRLGDVEGAEALHREALALRREAGPRTLPVAESLNNLGAIHVGRGAFEEARELSAEVLAIRRDVLTSEHPLTLQAMVNLAVPTYRCGDREGAMQLLEDAIPGLRALGADGAEGLARALSNLGSMQVETGSYDAADRNLTEALVLEIERLGEGHPAIGRLTGKLDALDRARGGG